MHCESKVRYFYWEFDSIFLIPKVVNIPIQTLIFSPWLVLRKMIISRVELRLPVLPSEQKCIEFRHKPYIVNRFDRLWSDVHQEPWLNSIILCKHWLERSDADENNPVIIWLKKTCRIHCRLSSISIIPRNLRSHKMRSVVFSFRGRKFKETLLDASQRCRQRSLRYNAIILQSWMATIIICGTLRGCPEAWLFR